MLSWVGCLSGLLPQGNWMNNEADRARWHEQRMEELPR